MIHGRYLSAESCGHDLVTRWRLLFCALVSEVDITKGGPILHHMKFSALLILLAVMPAAADNAKPAAPPAAESKDGVKHTDAAGAKKLLDEAAAKKDGKLVVLDVRTPEEFKAGHIAAATNIDFKAADFADKLGKLDKDKTYVLHCQSGRRSTASLEVFQKLGFKKIVHLDGGFVAWEKAGLPVSK